ncbi:olfactory receptor 5V1-like [Hyperolius riggenbachi]|uniref:olfactory receptor 5V1-like n=1 Tax=Hyperolius riggenbachi TaxID=752182 RepID=UPI0035A2EF96
MDNRTTINVFYLNVFSDNEQLKCLFFVLFLILYLVTITGNALIILLTHIDFHLHTPMYFFLKNLSFLDLCYISTTLPQMLANILIKHCAISLPACIVQLYFVLSLATSESSLLAAMAYDRYVAICNPLRYSVVMSHNICLNMVAGTFVVGSVHGAIHTANTFRLPFCGSGVLNHYFCDIPPLLKISCINTYVNEVTVFSVGGVVMFGCFLLIFGSYMQIFFSVLNIPKESGRKKAFSTCVSHLVVVFLFYGSGFITYMRPKSNQHADKEWLLGIIYTSITPLLNPIIYSLRNKEIKGALQKLYIHLQV